MRSGEVIKLLREDGWFVFNIRGSHHQFKHLSRSGKVTVPHPKADLPLGTVRSIFRQAGLNWQRRVR
jgi:predicted RNA binding protein YcfA (HicA-like mRNA interferase family)